VPAGSNPLTVTIVSSDVSVGVVKTLSVPNGSGSVTVQIQPGQSNSPTSVAAGGVAFDPVGTGTSTVSASIPGYIAQPNASRVVTVTAPPITANGTTVGGGLQRSTSGSLGASGHGGVTVRVTSSNPTVMRIAPDASTAGAPSIDVVVADGVTFVPFYVQGMDGATGTVTVTLTAPGFTDGQPGVIISGLGTSKTVADADDAFWATIGIPSGNGVSPQAVRFGATTLTVTMSSSDVSVGVVKTLSVPNGSGSVTVQILPGQLNSPTSVAAGGVAFDPLGTGTSTVSASIPGYITQPNGTVTVIVN